MPLRLSSVAALLVLACLALGAPAAAATSVHGRHDDATVVDPFFAAEETDPVVVVVGDVDVGGLNEVPRGVFVVSGNVTVNGRVDGDVTVLAGDVIVNGTVDGDLFLASGKATVMPGAEVTGDIRYADEKPWIALSATVGGEVREEDWPKLSALAWVAGVAAWLTLSVSAAILGLLLILIAPRAADAVAARSRERVGPTIAIGIAIAIVLPLLVGLAAITVLGLPLGIALGLALLPLAAVAYVASAWALGRRILGPPRSRYLAFLAGIGIFSLAGLVPVLGLLAWIAAVVFGLGLLGAAIGAAREAPAPPAAAD